MWCVTFPCETAGADPLNHIHTDQAEEHQWNWQLSEIIKCPSGIHL